jgi:hypothetical protein
MKTKKTVYSLFLFLFITCSALSQETAVKQEAKTTKSSAGGPATAKELVGFWKMIPLPNKAVNKVNPWPLAYQWFQFTESGKLYSMMLSDNNEYSSSELAATFKVLPKNTTPNYKVQGQFVTIDNPSVKNYKEIWGTNIFAKDIEGVAKAGDLIMTLDDGTNTGKVIYYRLLRRIK